MTSPEDVSNNVVIPVVATQLRKVRTGNVLFNLVILIVIAVMGGLNACEGRRGRAQLQEGVECLVEQFAEHRQADRDAHQAIVGKLGTTYPTEAGHLPEDVDVRLEEACAPFVRRR